MRAFFGVFFYRDQSKKAQTAHPTTWGDFYRSRQKLSVVGPVEIRFENRKTTTNAVVLPGADKILLGVIPIEDMDVLIDAKQEKLIVNPKTPYMASMSLR